MAITLTPGIETWLRLRAEHEGQNADVLADALLADALVDDLTEAETIEVREGIQRGLEAAATGHVNPLAQAVAEAGQRHGFPASWGGEICRWVASREQAYFEVLRRNY